MSLVMTRSGWLLIMDSISLRGTIRTIHHDGKTGQIAWFEHRTKRGTGYNWEVTSGAARGKYRQFES